MALLESFYENLIDNLYDGIYFVDRDRIITYWNRGAERLTGFSRQQVLGHSCKDNLLNHCTETGGELCLNGCPLTATISDGTQREADVFLRHSDGHRLPVRVRVSPIRDDNGQIIGAVETFSNNTDLFVTRHRAAHLEVVANRDPLTGAGNRLSGETRLRAAFIEYNLTHRPFGLFFIDLDNFKQINDTFGHTIGDRLLQMVTSTLRSNLRERDFIIRWGGDEFLVLVDIPEVEGFQRISEKLRNLIELSRLVEDGQSISVTASIGASLARPDDTPETLVARTDQLMYASKSGRGNRVTFG